MKCATHAIRSGYDKKKCFVHARCCYTPGLMVATAQYLNVAGCDSFSGLYMSTCTDDGKTWTEFTAQKGLAAIEKDGLITTGSDATPLYHKKPAGSCFWDTPVNTAKVSSIPPETAGTPSTASMTGRKMNSPE